MAAPQVSDNPEVNQHYATNVALTAALVASLRKLWPMINLADVPGSLPRYKTAVAAVVDKFAGAATSLSADHYEALRGSTIPGTFRAPIIDLPPVEKVQASLGWATSDLLVTGGDPSIHEPAPADTVTIVQDKVEAVAQKVVMDAGRNELIAAIEADTKARGWARVTKPDACYFCRMLATRGAVYANQFTAGRAANKRFTGDGEFKFHNNCHCTIEPLFGRHYEAPAHTRADMALWNKVTKGLSGQDAINAFRRAIHAQQH